MFDLNSGSQLGTLIANDGQAADDLGFSVAIDGNIVVAGAIGVDNPNTSAGAAYLFDVTTGQQLFRLQPAGESQYSLFGFAAAISGGAAVIGAPRDIPGENKGAAYVFDVATGQQLFKLTAPDAAPQDEFGHSVATQGNLVIVGTHQNLGPGRAYGFDISSGEHLFTLMASDADGVDGFGSSVAIEGDLVIIGAELRNNAVGGAYVFDLTTREELAILTASDGEMNDAFGQDVAIHHGVAVVGAKLVNDFSIGAVYLFNAVNGEQLASLSLSNPSQFAHFGSSLAIGPDRLVIGAERQNVWGAVYVYSLCGSDQDGDGLLDHWETGGMDINNDGIVDIDFPALGADPLHKDLFLDVDIMQNIPLINEAIEDVVFAFAFAQVDNPDGFPGITLHIDLTTADTIPFEESWDRDFVRFGEIKDGVGGTPGNFGTQEDRDSVNSEAILEAKKQTFRYCTIVNEIINSDGKHVLGVAERPGDDMMIAIGGLAGDRHVQGSTFMHELGHNLNLQHGGGDDINHKTNFVSVMSYGFDHWCDVDGNPLPLDYSSEQMLPLVEEHLDESAGIHSDFYSDAQVFHGYDNGSGGRQIGWVQLDGSKVDWNHDGTIDNDVAVDLNFVGSGYPDGDGDGNVLFGFNEWELLVLPLGTTGNYADSVHIAPETDGKTLEDLVFMRENLPPAPVNVAAITGFEIGTGTVLSGDSSDLLNSDNSYLHTRSGFGLKPADAYTTEIVISATTEQPSPARLDLLVESRISHSGGGLTLLLHNWNTDVFDPVATFDIDTAEATNFFKQIEAASYVGGGGEIEMKIKNVVQTPVPFSGFRFESFIDHVQITVR